MLDAIKEGKMRWENMKGETWTTTKDKRSRIQPAQSSNHYRFRFLFLSAVEEDREAMTACVSFAVGETSAAFFTGTPMWRPYRPLRPFPSSSLMHPWMPMPASLHRPQGR